MDDGMQTMYTMITSLYRWWCNFMYKTWLLLQELCMLSLITFDHFSISRFTIFIFLHTHSHIHMQNCMLISSEVSKTHLFVIPTWTPVTAKTLEVWYKSNHVKKYYEQWFVNGFANSHKTCKQHLIHVHSLNEFSTQLFLL